MHLKLQNPVVVVKFLHNCHAVKLAEWSKAPDLSSGTRKCAWVRTPHLTIHFGLFSRQLRQKPIVCLGLYKAVTHSFCMRIFSRGDKAMHHPIQRSDTHNFKLAPICVFVYHCNYTFATQGGIWQGFCCMYEKSTLPKNPNKSLCWQFAVSYVTPQNNLLSFMFP